MTVTADTDRHEVILTTDRGRTITLTWAAAVNLGSLLIQQGDEAEPVLPDGNCYAPTVGRQGV